MGSLTWANPCIALRSPPGLAMYDLASLQLDTFNAHCTCDRGDQTLKHVLLQCHRFRKERRQTLRSLQTNDISMILNDPDMVKKAAKFMIQTGLLGQFKAVRSILREAEEVDSLTR